MKKLLSSFFILGLIFTLSACDVDDIMENKTPENGNTSGSVVYQEGSDAALSSDSTASAITRESAINIALNHAGFKESDVINLTTEYDRTLSGDEWEVEFDKDGYEYSYEINAATGDIIKSEKEID